MQKFMIAGIGTHVGKTLVSAIITTLLQGDYWKPIQCGDEKSSDTVTMQGWLDEKKHTVHAPIYSFKEPVSPHQAAHLENRSVDLASIRLPETARPLVIEGVGGIFVPLTSHLLTMDLFKEWECQWILVSRNYLGSINHTLLTLQTLKQLGIPLLGIIFNGDPNPDTESAILEISKVPLLGRVLPEQNLNPQVIQRYAEQWKPRFSTLL